GVTFTTINMPLVRTPMIAPTKIYNNVPTLSPEEAADMIASACVEKPVRIATRLGVFGEVLHAFVPRVAQIVSNTTFRMFPDSAAAAGDIASRPATRRLTALWNGRERRNVVRRPATPVILRAVAGSTRHATLPPGWILRLRFATRRMTRVGYALKNE